MPLRRDQKLFPHFGEAGTAVFAVEEVEYGGHDPALLFELTCTISSKLSFILGPRCELDHSLFLIRTARSPSMAATGQDACEMAGILPDAASYGRRVAEPVIERGFARLIGSQ
jgi:hypothetical protein